MIQAVEAAHRDESTSIGQTLLAGVAASVAALVAAAATMAVSSNFFDGGTDAGNRAAAVAVGVSLFVVLVAWFVRLKMSPLRAVLTIVLSWAITAFLVISAWLLAWQIACDRGGCI